MASSSPDVTLRSSLESHLIPDQDLDQKCLDSTISQLTAEDIKLILTHMNNLYIPSPSIRPHILPFLLNIFLTRPDLSQHLAHSAFWGTLTLSLLMDDSIRLVEFGLRLVGVVLPGSVGVLGGMLGGMGGGGGGDDIDPVMSGQQQQKHASSSSSTLEPTVSTTTTTSPSTSPSFSGIGNLMAILGKSALMTTTQPQPRRHQTPNPNAHPTNPHPQAGPSTAASKVPQRRRRVSSSSTTTATMPTMNRRRDSHPGLGMLGGGGTTTGSGLGLALSTQKQQHDDPVDRDYHQHHHNFHDGLDLDRDLNLEDDDEDEDQDRLSFSPETLLGHLGGMMMMGGGGGGRRDLIRERKLGPKPGSLSALGTEGKGVWKVLHEIPGGLVGSGDDELGGSTGFSSATPTTLTTRTSLPTLSRTLSEYLSLLYTILPLNLVLFLSDPARYLDDKQTTGMDCPYEALGGWRDVWKQGELGRILSPYMRSFLFNPAFLVGSARSELEGLQTKYSKIEMDEIVGLAGSLSAVVPPHHLGGSDSSTGVFATGWTGTTAISPTSGSRPNLPPRSMTGTTDMTDSSSFSSSIPSAAVRRRRSSELALPVTATSNPLMAMSTRTAAGGVNAYAVASAHPIAIRSAAAGGGMMLGGASEVESERLRRRVEELTLELTHQKRLAGMYLQHVNRLYHSAVSARSGEAEQQNLYNHIKDQERLSEQKNRELQSAKDELARTRKSSSEEKARLSAKMAENRELKKQVSAKQGARNDEILDKESLITHLKSELSKEKEKNFKLDNRLREAEPKIKKIGDYEKQIDVFEENQLLWDEDIKTIQSQKDAVDKMTSVFVQMQNHTKAIQSEHDGLVDQVRTLSENLVQSRANLEAIQRRGLSTEPNPPDETSRSTAFFKEEMDSLKAKIEQAQMKIHDLEQEVLEAHADQEELDYLRRVQAQGKSSILA